MSICQLVRQFAIVASNTLTRGGALCGSVPFSFHLLTRASLSGNGSIAQNYTTPRFASTQGGTPVALFGSQFASNAVLFVNGALVNASFNSSSSSTAASWTSLTFIASATQAGHVRLTVANPPAATLSAAQRAIEPSSAQSSSSVYLNFATRSDLLYSVAPAALSCVAVGFWFHAGACEPCPSEKVVLRSIWSAFRFARMTFLRKGSPHSLGLVSLRSWSILPWC